MRLPRLRRALAAAYTVPVLALTIALAGCVNFVGLDDRLDDEEVRLDRAWRDWRDLDIYDYEFVVRRDCFCDAQTQRPVRVVVRNDAIVSLTFDDTGAPVPAAYYGLYPSVEGLFGIVEDAIDQDADDLDVRYDPTYAYPREVEIDYRHSTADEEITFRAYDFRPY